MGIKRASVWINVIHFLLRQFFFFFLTGEFRVQEAFHACVTLPYAVHWGYQGCFCLPTQLCSRFNGTTCIPGRGCRWNVLKFNFDADVTIKSFVLFPAFPYILSTWLFRWEQSLYIAPPLSLLSTRWWRWWIHGGAWWYGGELSICFCFIPTISFDFWITLMCLFV